jgi:multisubunit Na+/H+ antiporter MnhE subunit
MRRLMGLISFIFLFFYLIIKANLNVAKLVLFVPNNKTHPGFLKYSIQDLTFFEVLLLSQCITLTPGTITTKLDWENKSLTIHVLDLVSPQDVIEEIEKKLKEKILEFTR